METKDKTKARNKIFHYLKYRLRSEREIRTHFKARIEASLLEELIAQLKEQGFIDDERFACLLAEEKLKGGYGRIYIFHELLRKGIDKSIIGRVLEGIDNSQELGIAKIIVGRKVKEKEPLKRKGKIYALLKRRGFDEKIITSVIEGEDIGNP